MDDDDDVEVVGERGACTTVAMELDIWVEGRHSGFMRKGWSIGGKGALARF